MLWFQNTEKQSNNLDMTKKISPSVLVFIVLEGKQCIDTILYALAIDLTAE